MIELFAAVESEGSQTQEKVNADLEERCEEMLRGAVLDELKTNFPRNVKYVEAAKTKDELVGNMEQMAEFGLVRKPCDMVKITVSIKAEIIKR